MVRVALDVHHLGNCILRLVSQRVNDDAAAHRTIRTGAARLRGARNFQARRLRVDRSQIKSQSGQADSSSDCTFKESATGQVHLCASDKIGKACANSQPSKSADLTNTRCQTAVTGYSVLKFTFSHLPSLMAENINRCGGGSQCDERRR